MTRVSISPNKRQFGGELFPIFWSIISGALFVAALNLFRHHRSE